MLQLLTAVDEGLGALYFGIVPEKVSRSGTPSGCRRSRADRRDRDRVRRGDREAGSARAAQPIEELVHYGTWSK